MPPNVIDISIELLRQVNKLHKHRIIHCDLKTDNNVMDNNGHVHVMDFHIQ